jgi:predicted Zn-dependent protease
MNLSPVRATALAIGLLYEFSFTPVNLKEINAFALPGGPMFVHRGMFDAAASEGEVAGVMAHELFEKQADLLGAPIMARAGYLTIVPEKDASTFQEVFRRVGESIRLTEVR